MKKWYGERWRPPTRGESILLLVLLAFVLLWFAWYKGFIPLEYHLSEPAKADATSVQIPGQAASAAQSADAAKRARDSADFAADGAAKYAAASASSARASAGSASAALSAERKAAAHEAKAEKAASRAEAARRAQPTQTATRKSQQSTLVADAAQDHPAVEPGVSGEFRWTHFGAAPYASSREEAMRKRVSAFRALGLPESVATMFLLATDTRGQPSEIATGKHLDAMLSAGGAAHKNVVVAWAAPVRGMQYVATAEQWTVAWEGHTYTLLLPEVCNNWSLIVGLAPQPAPGAVAVPPPAPIATSAACPEGWSVTAYTWSLGKLSPALREDAYKLISQAERRDSRDATLLEPYRPQAFSRTLHSRLMTEPWARAPVDVAIRMRFLDQKDITKAQEIGQLDQRKGSGIFHFSDDPRKYVVEMIWPDENVSPTASGGKRRLRIFPYEWTICGPAAHGAIP